MPTAKDILDNVKSMKDVDTTAGLSKKAVYTASLIGAGVGIGIGYSRKFNLLMSAFIGAAIFGLTANYFINKKTND
jgi:hypothetical protein